MVSAERWKELRQNLSKTTDKLAKKPKADDRELTQAELDKRRAVFLSQCQNLTKDQQT